MKCPKCPSEIKEMRLEGVDFDFCSSCKGIWFDKDEMAFMAELPVDVPQLQEVRKGAKNTDFSCPRCQTKLEEMKFVQNKDLLIDRCPGCQGIWLDTGELKKVENIASTLSDPKSKIMLAFQQFNKKSYQVLGVRILD